MTPQDALAEMLDAGIAQHRVVSQLQQQGVQTTQATISRLHTGEIVEPRFGLGAGLIALHQRLKSEGEI